MTPLLLALGVLLPAANAGEPPRKRLYETRPSATRLLPALPAGQAVARLAVSRGGGDPSAPRRESGLVVILRHGEQQLRQTVLSCRSIAQSSDLGISSDDELALATCDGVGLRLRTGRGKLWLEMEQGRRWAVAAEWSLPSGIERAVPEALSARDEPGEPGGELY